MPRRRRTRRAGCATPSIDSAEAGRHAQPRGQRIHHAHGDRRRDGAAADDRSPAARTDRAHTGAGAARAGGITPHRAARPFGDRRWRRMAFLAAAGRSGPRADLHVRCAGRRVSRRGRAGRGCRRAGRDRPCGRAGRAAHARRGGVGRADGAHRAPVHLAAAGVSYRVSAAGCVRGDRPGRGGGACVRCIRRRAAVCAARERNEEGAAMTTTVRCSSIHHGPRSTCSAARMRITAGLGASASAVARSQ